MTIEEAISDPGRPLSVPPGEWVQYSEAREAEEKQLVDDEAVRLVAEGEGAERPVSAAERLDIGIEQMVLGCKMAIRALHSLERENAGVAERDFYNAVSDVVFNALAPYLADILRFRNDHTR